VENDDESEVTICLVFRFCNC